jgi:nitrogen fixation NifU-like protein
MAVPSQQFFGRMNDPDASAWLKGPCGDEMEFYLIIEDNHVTDIKYYTDGCDATKLCGEMVARLSLGKTIDEVLCISAGEVKKSIKNLPNNHVHCTILSVSVLYRAIADYLLKRNM